MTAIPKKPRSRSRSAPFAVPRPNQSIALFGQRAICYRKIISSALQFRELTRIRVLFGESEDSADVLDNTTNESNG